MCSPQTSIVLSMLLPAHDFLNHFLTSVGHFCRLEYSHFVSVPLNSSATLAAFEHFKLSVTGDPQAAKARIEESIFVATKQIHLTVMMLKLYSEQKRHLAKQVRYCCAQSEQRVPAPTHLPQDAHMHVICLLILISVVPSHAIRDSSQIPCS